MNAIKTTVMISLVAILNGTATAAIITQYQGTSYKGMSNQNEVLAKVIVGTTNVLINGFGVYGQAQVAGNLKWVIFESTQTTSPVYLSLAEGVTGNPGTFATKAKWYDSPAISYTLLANHTYAMGVLSDQVGTNTFNWGSSDYSPFGGTPTVTGGGLSMPFMEALSNSGVSSGAFTSTPTLYTVNNSGSYETSLRVSVPEPATLLSLGGGLSLMLLRRRRQLVGK